MQYTPNYNLRMPEDGELYNVHDFNINEEIIDTALKNISDAENETSADLRLHVNDTSNPHSVTKEQILLGNVENKSSETIRNEITKQNVVRALGYTPQDYEERNVIEGYLDDSDLDKANWKFYFEYDSSTGEYDLEVPIYPDRIYVNLLDKNIYHHQTDLVENPDYDPTDPDSQEFIEYSYFEEISKSLKLGETSDTAFSGSRGVAVENKANDGKEAYDVRAKEIWLSNYDHSGTSVDYYANPEIYSLEDDIYEYSRGGLTLRDRNTLLLLGKNITLSNTETDHDYIDLRHTPADAIQGVVRNAVKLELTDDNVKDALGYTPLRKDTNADEMQGATSSAAGSRGLVPTPSAGDQDKALFGDGTWRTVSSGGGGSGTDDYNDLSNKPSINSVVLSGNKSLSDLGIVATDATQSTHGLMSANDKTKLDGIEANANNYTHPTTSGYKHIPSGGSSGQILEWSADGEAQWADYPLASTTTAGLMSSADFTKLDSVETNANYVAVKGDAEDEYRTGEVNITPANIGLGNVGNFKAVSTVGGQGLTEEEKAAARANIDAGYSDFSGDYYDLTNLPTLGTASEKDITSSITGTYNVPTDKAVKTFVEGKGYIDNAVDDLVNYYKKSETYTKSQVDALIALVPTFDIQVVQVLPTEDISTTTIYLVLSGDPESGNIYDEYIYINNAWEKLGSQTIMLDGVIYGEGTSGHIAVFSDTDEIEDGPAFGNDSTKFLRNDGTWAVPPGGSGGSTDWSDITNKPSFGTASLADTTSSITGSSDLPTDLAVKTFVEGKNYITNAVNDLTNYYKKSETYTQAEINNLISLIPIFDIEVIQSLPVSDISDTTVYLVLNGGSQSQNLYDEYIHVNNTWEKLGSQTIDLNNYYTSAQVDTLLAGKASTSVATSSANGLMSSDDKSKVDAMPTLTRVSGTLIAGQTSLTLNNAAITTNSYLQVYTSVYGKVTLTCVPTNGSVTLTYEAEQNNMDVEVWCYNFPSA